MYFLFSGEGSTDFGVCANSQNICEGNDYQYGPMAIFVDQIVKEKHKYSLLESAQYGFVSKQMLVESASELKSIKKSPRLPGKKKAKETGYFYSNARALAFCAKEKETELKDDVVAILFRDSDGTASAERGLWENKRESMIQGFQDEEFLRGVPMIPKPKSEAWILCALKNNPYQRCELLENRSGNDDSPNSLKKELEKQCEKFLSREELCEMVRDYSIDIKKIKMPSFEAFQTRLKEVLSWK
jgi:hypothetical protein